MEDKEISLNTSCKHHQHYISLQVSSTHLMRDSEHHIFLPEQRCHHRILRMGMYARASVTECKCIPEERRASRLFEVQLGATEKDPIGMRRRFCLGIWQDEYVRRLDTFFLYAWRGDVYFVATDRITDQYSITWRNELTQCGCRHPHRYPSPIPIYRKPHIALR